MSAAAEGRSAWSRSSTRSWTVIEAIRKRPRLGVARPKRKEIVLRALHELLAGDQAAETGATEPEFRRRNQDDAGPVQAARPAPGCGRTRFLEVHHLRPRSRGGSNDPDNLVTLCSTCHRHAHERAGVASARLDL